MIEDSLETILDLPIGATFIFLYHEYILISYKSNKFGFATVVRKEIYESKSPSAIKAAKELFDHQLFVVRIKK